MDGSLNFHGKRLDFSALIDIIILFEKIAEWCNGSTADSDSVSGGSNPSSVAKKIAFCAIFFWS